MTLVKNPTTKRWEADIRDRAMGRLHVSLATKVKAEAIQRHAAVEALVRSGRGELVDLLRRRRLNVAAVTTAAQPGHSFDELLPRTTWALVADAVEGYVGSLEAHQKRSDKTAAVASSQLAHFVAFVAEHPELGSATRLDEVTSKHFLAYQALLAGKFKPNTLTNYVTRVGAVYRWAQRQEDREARDQRRPARVLHSPIDPETQPSERTRRDRWLKPDEAERLLAATPPQLRFAVACGLFAGLRVDEMLKLRVPPFDIDLELGILTVQAKEVAPDVMWRPKGGLSKEDAGRRHIPIVADFRPIIERHVERFAGDVWMMPSFLDRALPMRETTLHPRFTQVVRDAGLRTGRSDPQGVVYHTLRHTFASWLAQRGTDLYTIAQLLGNSLRMVEKTYAHLAPDFKRSAVGRLAGLISIPTDTDDREAPDNAF